MRDPNDLDDATVRMRSQLLALALAAAAGAAAAFSSVLSQKDVDASIWAGLQRVVREKRFAAPVLDLTLTPRFGDSFPDCTPTVLVHGLGDAGHNAGMQSLAQSIMTAYPGCYATAVDVADGILSFIQPIQAQIDELYAIVKADAKLAQGFNIVGLSQGGLIARGFVQQHSAEFPVKNMVSICGTQNGIYACPLQVDIVPFLCELFEANPYAFLLNGSIPLSFSDYFTMYWDVPRFLTENKFLPPTNNLLGSGGNATRNKAAILSLNLVLLSEATGDTVVFPFASEQFGGYVAANGTKPLFSTTYNFTQGAQYTEDLLGLGTLYNTGKITLSSFDGNHLQFSDAYWNSVVLPYLH